MIIIDTNVISELMRPRPEPRVVVWVAQQITDDIFLTSITVAELFRGLVLMAEGRRKQALIAETELLLAEDFEGLVLPFDEAAARQYGVIVSMRQRLGRPISTFDAQIAAIAAAHGATVATRNVADFEHCGVTIINPWTE